MNKSHLISVLATSFLLVSGVQAATIVYQYTGNNFDTFPFTSAPGAYDTTMSVTGSFTVQDTFVLPTTLTDIEADLLSYSFFDGRNTLTEANSDVSVAFRIRANGSGQIIEWDIPLVSVPAAMSVGDEEYTVITKNFPGGAGNIRDSGRVAECFDANPSCTFNTDLAQISANPGTWSAFVVPLPSAVCRLAVRCGAFGYDRNCS